MKSADSKRKFDVILTFLLVRTCGLAPRQVITIVVLVNAGVDSTPQSTNGRSFWYDVGPHSDYRTEWALWTVAIHNPPSSPPALTIEDKGLESKPLDYSTC